MASVNPCMQVGGEAWRQQHDAVVALSVQAHHNAATRSDEFVKEALVLHDKLRVLVFDLLVHEVRLTGPACRASDSIAQHTSAMACIHPLDK